MHRAVTTVCRRLLQVTSKTSSQTPQVSSISPGRRITSCATQKATDVKYRTDLKNVTIIDTCSRAAFAIDKLLRLPSERKVAWSTQHAPHHSFAPNTPTVTAAVFAGGDVDFGNGSYMFICAGDVAERQRIWKLFQTYFEDEAVRKVWFDYPISAHHLSLLGITTRGYVADIHQLLGMNNRKGLPLDLDILSKEVVFSRKKAKAKRVLNYNDLSIQTPRPWLEPPTTPEQNPDRVWIARACHDASQIYHIEARLDDTLRPCQVHNHNSIFNLRQSFRRFFAPFSDLLHDMYRTGVHISPHKLSQQQHDATESIESLELKFRHWAFWHSPDAWHMDLASSSQLRQLLFAPIANARNADDKLDAEKQFEITDATGNMRRINIKGVGLRPVSYTPCGWPSVSKSALKKAAGEQTKSSEPDDGEFRSAIHALVKSQEIRRLHESCETFISRNRRKNERVGVRHVVQAVSGRVENEISCRKWKYRLQGGISAAEGNGLLIVRYEDAEFVAMVNLTRCERLKERVGSRECDMTSLLASELSNEVYDAWRKGDVTMKKGKGGVEDRFEQAYHAAKMLDIGMRHGGSAEVIAAKVGCTRGEANELALRWYEAHPGVAEWRVESERFVMRNGFLESRMGRRRHVKKKWPRDRASAMGYAVSGTAGEMVMGGMLSLNRDENVKGLRWNIVFADREFVVLEGPIEALECVRESIVEAAEKPEGVGFEFLKPRVVLMEEEDLGGIGERGIAIEGKSFGRRGGDGGGLWGVDGRIGILPFSLCSLCGGVAVKMSFIRPLSRKASANKTAVSRMLRVDHAGEIAARQIYNGQLLIFRNTSVGKVISHMAAQEQKHLDEFDKLIRLRRVRPTALLPVWSAAGYALGLGTALLGRRAAMACTVAVEEVIADHYGAQVRELEQRGGEPDLCHVFKEFRNDELEHKHTGLEHEAEQAPFYRALTAVIQTGCRAAISITERV